MFAFLFNPPVVALASIGRAADLFVLLGGVRVIGEDESGLVIKRFGRALPPGRLIALDGQAGLPGAAAAARLALRALRVAATRCKRVPMVVVPPGEIALVVAADGASIPPSGSWAARCACDHFQDAEAFLRNGGERGRQLAFLTAGTYRINTRPVPGGHPATTPKRSGIDIAPPS